ncbi:MAG: GAF domain-containing protein, partial [Rhodocyclaceae bacterium]|nr:GAF domain-containing protein [Rhodocyclaceae bacterium]
MTTLQPLEISGDIELPALSPHGGKTWVSPALADALGQVLDAAFELAGADFGDIQLLDAAARPRTAVQRNFPDWWVDYWDTAAAANGACAAALAQGGPVVIEDIERSPLLAGTPALAILRNAEVRALLCMPMRGGSGQIFGTLAVHYRKPQAPPRASLAHLELLARHGGMLAEQARDAQCAGMNQRRFE